MDEVAKVNFHSMTDMFDQGSSSQFPHNIE